LQDTTLDTVKDVIPESYWDVYQHIVQFELLKFGKDKNEIVITVGLLVLLFLSIFIVKLILRLIRRIYTRKMDAEEKIRFLAAYNFTGYFVYILVIVSLISTSGIDITLLLTATAVLFVGLGLAMREIFQDIIGGVYIIFDKSVQAGDIIELNGMVCKVFDTKLRTTLAVTRDDKVIVIPNHKFVTDAVINFTQNYNNTRQSVSVRVALDEDVEKVREVLVKAALTQERIIKSPEPFVMLEEFGEYALHFGVYFYISETFFELRIKSELRFEIEREFRKNNIRFPYPQRDLNIKQFPEREKLKE
jgi:small-conductance mechanosensitive channel